MKFLARTACSLALFVSAAGISFAQAPAPATPDPATQVGRKALTDYLNSVGYKETAARRALMAKITTRAQAEARQREVRTKIFNLLGTEPKRVPLNPRITGSTTLPDGVRVDKVIFDSQPNFPITALLYTPANPGAQKFPAIVMAPGNPEQAMKAWLKNSPLDGTQMVSDEANVLRQAQNQFGAFQWYDVIFNREISPRIRIIYLAMNYESGPLFSRFVFYHTDRGWIVTSFDFNFDDTKILPLTVE